VLRVRTDSSIVSVVAMFPFGLVKPLHYLDGEDVWQTRFLAPTDMADGVHPVRMILRDRMGRVFRETKTFVIAGKPPIVRVKLDRMQFRRGETIALQVSASATTRTIVARLAGMAPVHLRWNGQMKSNTGAMIVPQHLEAGRYKLTVTAEDFAHNIGSQEVSIEVLP
jgi:Ca-activated chloride channel family protein